MRREIDMVAVPNLEPHADDEPRVLLHNISWDQYERLLETFGHRPGLRLTYCEGALEIMTTSGRHETVKKRLARLVEAWGDFAGINLEGYGETSFRRRAKERGCEPDECYLISATKGPDEIPRPDIAIEVVVSNPLLDKLNVWAGLEVPEVWVWRDGVFTPWILEGGIYRSAKSSELVPVFDFELIARIEASGGTQREAVNRLREELSKRGT